MMPDSLAQVYEDGECETPAEERAREKWCDERATELMGDADWWDSRLDGVNTITAELPYLLSRCASNVMASNTANARGMEILRVGMAITVGSFMNTIARDAARAQAAEEYEGRERG